MAECGLGTPPLSDGQKQKVEKWKFKYWFCPSLMSTSLVTSLVTSCGPGTAFISYWPSGWALAHILVILSFFPRLISAVGDWMSTIHRGLSANLECRSETCCTRLAANTGRKKVAKNRHLATIAQLRRAIFSQIRHVSTIDIELLTLLFTFMVEIISTVYIVVVLIW